VVQTRAKEKISRPHEKKGGGERDKEIPALGRGEESSYVLDKKKKKKDLPPGTPAWGGGKKEGKGSALCISRKKRGAPWPAPKKKYFPPNFEVAMRGERKGGRGKKGLLSR